VKLFNSLTKHQVLNLSLSVFLFVGVLATTYSVVNLTTFQSEAKGRKIKPPSCAQCTLVVSPNPVPAYSSFHVDGCGYTGTAVQMNLVQPTGVAAWAESVGSDGCTHFDYSVNGPGAYTLNAYQGLNFTLMASVSFSVQ